MQAVARASSALRASALSHCAMGDAVLIELRPRVDAALCGAVAALPGWHVYHLHGAPRPEPVCGARQRFLGAHFPREYARGLLTYNRTSTGWWKPREWFNRILTNPRFWELFDRAYLLLFQIDAAFCPRPTYPIDHFLRYAFVGAPWRRTLPQCVDTQSCVGNCGLGLFRRSAARAALPHYHAQRAVRNFDLFLMRHLQERGIAPERVASAFSVETVMHNRSVVPFGVHNPYPHLTAAELRALEARCPPMTRLHNAYHSNLAK